MDTENLQRTCILSKKILDIRTSLPTITRCGPVDCADKMNVYLDPLHICRENVHLSIMCFLQLRVKRTNFFLLRLFGRRVHHAQLHGRGPR